MYSDLKFTFDDFLLVPDYAEEDTRENPDATKSFFFDWELDVPIISSPMDSVSEEKMLTVLWNSGAIGVHHRYCNFQLQKDAITNPEIIAGGIAISPSMNIDEIVSFMNKNSNCFAVVDVAHGDSKKVIDFCKNILSNGIRKIVSGNIVTLSAAQKYLNMGISYLRVGMGNGSVCSTRGVTGFGYPQASAVYNIWKEFPESYIISDGGCKTTGDICKALSLGAKKVMSGRMFAGTDECPKSKKGQYRGMASEDALSSRKTEFFVEGESTTVPMIGSASKVVKDIKEALLHACHYGGLNNIWEIVDTEKVFITQSVIDEGKVRK
jgi:IMP dehydrogenase